MILSVEVLKPPQLNDSQLKSQNFHESVVDSENVSNFLFLKDELVEGLSLLLVMKSCRISRIKIRDFC